VRPPLIYPRHEQRGGWAAGGALANAFAAKGCATKSACADCGPRPLARGGAVGGPRSQPAAAGFAAARSSRRDFNRWPPPHAKHLPLKGVRGPRMAAMGSDARETPMPPRMGLSAIGGRHAARDQRQRRLYQAVYQLYLCDTGCQRLRLVRPLTRRMCAPVGWYAPTRGVRLARHRSPVKSSCSAIARAASRRDALEK
jgi:hypothetical protein